MLALTMSPCHLTTTAAQPTDQPYRARCRRTSRSRSTSPPACRTGPSSASRVSKECGLFCSSMHTMARAWDVCERPTHTYAINHRRRGRRRPAWGAAGGPVRVPVGGGGQGLQAGGDRPLHRPQRRLPGCVDRRVVVLCLRAIRAWFSHLSGREASTSTCCGDLVCSSRKRFFHRMLQTRCWAPRRRCRRWRGRRPWRSGPARSPTRASRSR